MGMNPYSRHCHVMKKSLGSSQSDVIQSHPHSSPLSAPAASHPRAPNLRPQPATRPAPQLPSHGKVPSTQHTVLCNEYVFMYMKSSRWIMCGRGGNFRWTLMKFLSLKRPGHTAGLSPSSVIYHIAIRGGETTVQNIINMKIINMDLGAERALPQIMRTPWLVMQRAHIYY